eukprot:TRINITY_DN14636_c0_g1_i2.p1 TRINITY_DN14636_c0_g1~~TRINITY_DN14636_c0_g1_i2.p1  ORF type:complete len:332 (+),score=-2.16 TRINITY_DN14636_c0_g1_i2:150-998(+)
MSDIVSDNMDILEGDSEILVPAGGSGAFTGSELTEATDYTLKSSIAKVDTGNFLGTGIIAATSLKLGVVICKPKVMIGDFFVCGIVLSAGHVLNNESIIPSTITINGKEYEGLPIFNFKDALFSARMDPLSGQRLSCGTDFSAFTLLSKNQTDRDSLIPLPIYPNVPMEGQSVRTAAYFPASFTIERAAPWAIDAELKMKITKILKRLKGSLCISEGKVLKESEGIFAATCSTVAGMSGCPCLIDRKVCGILHGGPVCVGHNETNILMSLINSEANQAVSFK